MNNTGTSLLGRIQTEGHATADNLLITAANLSAHEAALKTCLAHQEAATGDSKQDDMRRLRDLVTGAIGRERDCVDAIASAGRRCRAIVDAL